MARQLSFAHNDEIIYLISPGSFTSSALGHQLIVYLDGVERRGSVEDPGSGGGGRYFPVGKFPPNSPDSGLDTEPERFIDTTHHSTPFWRQYRILVMRYYALATRDPTMYLLQFILSLAFAFFIGAVFFQLPRRIDISMYNIPAGILWIILLMSFIQIFKVGNFLSTFLHIDDNLLFVLWKIDNYCASILICTTPLLSLRHMIDMSS